MGTAAALLSLALLASFQDAGGPTPDGWTIVRAWLCPLHPETQLDEPGRCEVCGRPLEKRAFTYSWACPMHPELAAPTPGPCAVCGMDRVSTTVEVVWRCPRHAEAAASEPGACPHDGTPLVAERRALAHGDHNPRHGGVFFMAPDRFHHLEGALLDGRFRLYLYDNYTEPLDPAGIAARIGELRLAPGADAAVLEAPLEAPPGTPVEVVLHVDFGSGREERFDFLFTDESRPPELPELVIPGSPAEMLDEIERRDVRLRELMRLGAWTELYLPALQAKDLVLALEAAAEEVPADAVKRMVRGAWLLDVYGDLGDRTRVERAYLLFREGLAALREGGAR